MISSSRRLLVLDDDPTGSQCVQDVSVVLDEDTALIADALSAPGSTCFVLTNTRALGAEEAREKNRRILSGVLEAASWSGSDRKTAHGLHVVSRSDSTLRGHVIEEPNELADVLEEHGLPVDGFLFCPAMLEAGRFTRNSVHYAVVGGVETPVAQTDFAQDATFGYSDSNLADFLESASRAQAGWPPVRAEEVLVLSLEDIREGGVNRVESLLRTASNRQWVIVNATEYADMETVVDAVTSLEAEGRTFITRCGPSFVRPLPGQHVSKPLTDAALTSQGERMPHGLVVVGSHVGLTTKQLAEVQRRGGVDEFELSVEKLLDPGTREHHLDETVRAVTAALETSDAVIFTSRDLVRDSDPAASLEIARSVSDAVVKAVQRIRSVRPAWVVAKGGITSHEVASSGLGISLARVEGQFFPGQISLFTPLTAPAEVLGMPYVVFPGNVGGESALADVIEQLKTRTHTMTSSTTMTKQPSVAWIGLGAMGGPMSLAVARAGMPVTAFDMSTAALDAVAPEVAAAPTAQEAVTGADVVAIMVATGQQLQSVLFGSPERNGLSAVPGIAEVLTPETVVLVMATVGPAAIEAALTGLSGVTARLVDAPVSGGVARAKTGELLVMVSGAEADVAAVQPLLNAMAANAPVVGPRPGDGQKLKIVNQLLCGVHIAAAGEALALAESMGLDVAQVHEVLGTGAAASFMFSDRGARMVSESFDDVRSALDIFVKDMGLVTEAARGVAQPVPLASSAEQLYLRGRREGLGRKDDSVVFDILRGR